ncbi:PHP domain-containing protein [Maribellus luteus]|uniref:PHP domain-containing protein n=1 Tax=Maribellus luteus TaxID=2305463 RepID=A0A399STX6_9BACT|nr:PHP domain-containing protein [Maribellus luteus]RIJ46244.1 PHP domain-containing protein [Maribellus luteus]
MQQFRADLHIHTVLSPCADVEMSPANIVQRSKESGLSIIGIADHNSTRNAWLVKELAQKEGIFVLTGAEVTTKEEVHCLAFFETQTELLLFQAYLEENIGKIPNKDGHFGYQPVVDADENILEMVPYYLTSALNKGISNVQKKVDELNGIFIPAHVNRPLNGLFSQLGFLPPRLRFDALEVTGQTKPAHIRERYNIGKEVSLVYDSDAHFPEDIGRSFSSFYLEEVSFSEIKMALNRQNNRYVEAL